MEGHHQITAAEEMRIAVLRSLNILDTAAEEDFDDIATLAASICNAPIALISCIDKDRQWFKAKKGVDINETPRNISFCSHAIETDILIVHDLAEDERFSCNPFVTGEPFVRFYAGIPLVLKGGYKIGTLCVLDTVTRKLTEKQLSSLKILNRQVVKFIELRSAISDSESKLTAYFNSTSEEVFLVDPQQKIIAFNKEAEKNSMALFNLQPVVGDNMLKHVEPYIRPKYLDHFAKALSGLEQRHESLVHHKPGSQWWQVAYVPVRNEKNEIVGVAFTNLDITERKKAEEALNKSENNLRAVFDNTEVGYLLINDKLEILSFNQPAFLFVEREFNKTLKAGESVLSYYPNDLKEIMQKLNEAFETGHSIEFDYHFHRQDKEDDWYSVKYLPVRNKEKNIIGLVLSFKNITNRKRSEIELNNSFSLVSKQNKRLLSFSYIVSHNLRSHATNIKSIIPFLQEASSKEEVQEMLGYLTSVSDSLDETLMNLNEVVSIDNNINLIFEPLVLRDYAEKTISLLQHQAQHKNVAVTNQIPANIIVKYNPAFLESIIFNFLSNGIKYSSPVRKPYVYLDGYIHNNKPVLQVTDNGLGIDLERHGEKLFGMYKTFHGNDDARGIGLFISKSQVEFMGGHIEVESEPDKGSVFKIFF